MGKKQNIEKRSIILAETIDRWLEVEEETIRSSETVIAATESILIRQVMNLIRRDSEKHREALQTIREILGGTLVVQPEEVGQLNELLEKHLQIEFESLILARSAMDNNKNFVVKQLLRYLLEDERKHVTMTEQVTEIKKKLY